MLSLFRRNLFVNILLLLTFTVALLAAWPFLGQSVSSSLSYSTFPSIAEMLSVIDANKYITVSLTIVLIFLQAILLNNLITRHKLSRALSTIPAAVFVLFAAIAMQEQQFHPVLIANAFCLLSLNSLFKIYKKHLPIATIFNSGFWMAIATIIYQPYFIYFFVLLIGLYSMRNLSLRESLQMFLGLLAPIGLFAVLAFYLGKLDVLLSSTFNNFSLPSFSIYSLEDMAKPLLLFLLILVATFFHHEIKKKKKFDAIKKIEIAYWLMLLSILTIFLVAPLQEAHMMLISIPLAITLGLYLELKSNSVIKEFVFLLMVGVYVGFLLDVV